MALRWFYRDADGGISEFVNRVRTTEMSLTSNAFEGTIASSRIPILDPDADFDIGGHRKVYVVETGIDTSSDPSAGVVWVGYTAEREVSRELERVEDARTWGVQVVDINTTWERRLLLGDDCNRPAETDVERMTWLAGTNELELVDSTAFLSTEDPVDMEANDYRKQSPMSVLRDCMDQSGKNGYVINLKTTPDVYGDPNLFALWYGHDSLPTWASSIRISNDLSDVDLVSVFPPAIETVLTIDPSRVYDEVIVDYDGGYVVVRRLATGTAFARRTTTLSAPNVHSAAQARARGRRFLEDCATEEHSIKTAIIVTGPQLNALREGHAVDVKFTHLPGYETFVTMRVEDRTISDLTDDVYQVDVTLVGPAVAAAAPDAGTSVYGILYQPHNAAEDSRAYFGSTGDAPASGYSVVPTVGLIEVVTDPPPSLGGNYPNVGFKMLGDGTLARVRFTCDAAYVGSLTTGVDFAITLNGSPIEVIHVAYVDTSGFPYYAGAGPVTVEVTNLAVSTDDVIGASVTKSGNIGPWVVPSGAGNLSFGLEISGGTLA